MSRRLVRRIRNLSSSPAELKIKNATSNDSFGPSTSQLNEVAILTLTPEYNQIIIEVIRKRIQDSSWRHILKCLTVIEYVLLVGSLDFVNWMKKNKYLVSTLKEFTVKNNPDVSKQIRHKSKTIMKLLNDDTVLTEKRSNFHMSRSQMANPAVGRASSLDISRNNENINGLQIVTNDLPEFTRASKSLEIIRNNNNAFASENGISPLKERFQDTEVHRLLADIAEE